MKIVQCIFSALLLSSVMTIMATDLDTEAFWTKAVELFDRAGYGAQTDFGKHARTNLQRVQTLHQHGGGTAATGGGTSDSVGSFLSGILGGSQSTSKKTKAPVHNERHEKPVVKKYTEGHTKPRLTETKKHTPATAATKGSHAAHEKSHKATHTPSTKSKTKKHPKK